ncbi:unnamed protein product [Closterium sp. NIES-53]
MRRAARSSSAHASGALKAPLPPEPLPTDPEPTPTAQTDYDCRVLARDVWDSRDAATALALTELLPPTEAVHFAQVDTAQGIWDAVVARYSTPSSSSLNRLLMPFLLPPPPPMWLTVHWLVTSLPDRLATARDMLLQKHPTELAIDLLETALGKIESNLLSVASATDAVPPRLFVGCAAPQLPIFTTTRASVTVSVVEDTAAVFAADWQKRDKSGKKGGKGGGGGSGGGGGGGAGSGGDGGGGGGAQGGGSLGGGAGQTGPPTGSVQTGGGPGSSGRSSKNSSWAPCPPRRDTDPCDHWCLTGPGSPCVCGLDDHSTARCFRRLDDLYVVASLSFMLDSGTSQCFFRDHTTLTPLLAPVPVALADPSSGSAVADSSTTHPCPVVPSGVLRGLHIPSFTRNLVDVGYLHDRGITVTFVGVGRTAVCTDAVTGKVLATFTREPRSGLYVLHTEHSPVSTSPQVAVSPQVPAPPPVVESSQVATSPPVVVPGQVAASCSCRSFTHRTVLWHHRLGHPTIPCLRTMANHRLVSGLPHVFPSLPPSPAPPCNPCIVGRLRAAPHSSSLRPTTAPFQTLHLDVWGPAPTQGPERERYFLVVVDDFSRYNMVFPLTKKSEVTSTLIRWLLATEGTRGHLGIVQSWTLPESPQKNGVAERHIGVVMDIARTSMIHARAPHFLWPYAVRYAAHQLNLHPRVSRPEASPTSLWTGSPASADWSFYHPPLHLDSCDVRFDESVSYYTRYPCTPPPPLFLAPSLPPTHTPPVLPPPPSPAPSARGAATSGTRSGGARSRGVEAGGVGAAGASSGGAGAGGSGRGGASSRGAGAGGAGASGASSGGARAGGAGTGGASSGGAGAGGAGTGRASFGGAGAGGAGTRLPTTTTPPHRHDTRFQALRRLEREEKEQLEQERQEFQQLDQHQQKQQPRGAGAGGAGTGGASSGGARAGGASTGGASFGGPGVEGLGTGGARTGGAGAGHPDTIGTPSGDTEHSASPPPRHALPGGLPACARGAGAVGAGAAGFAAFGPARAAATAAAIALAAAAAAAAAAIAAIVAAAAVAASTAAAAAPSGAAAVPALWSSPPPQSPPPVVRHYRSRPYPPSARPLFPVTDLHTALLSPSPRRSPPPVSFLPSPPPSSLPVSPTPISDYYRVVCPVVSRVLATGVTDPCFSPSSVSALAVAVANFAAASRLDYSTRVVPAPPTRPLSVGGEFDLRCDVLEDRHSELEYLAAASPTLCAMLLSPEGDPDALDIPTPRTYCEAVSGPWASQWKAAMDSELASLRSTGTHVDAVPPPRANVVDGMWLFKVKWPPGSPPVFKVRYVARGFSQREGVDFFQTFAPTPKMTTLRVLLHVAAQRDYELHSLDFSTAFLRGRLHKEIWLRHPPGFIGTFPTGTQWNLRRPVYGLRLTPREWHDTLRSTLCDLGFCPFSADPSLFVRARSTPFFILVYVDDLIIATPDRAAKAEVKSELQKRDTCTDLGEVQCYLGLQITRDRAARTITLT